MTTRRSIPLCILLSLITCGIYTIYWMVVLTDETNAAIRQDSTSGGMVVLLSIVTCGIYGLYWYFTMGNKLEELRANTGRPSGDMPLLLLLLGIFGFGIVSFCIMQHELNAVADC